MKKIIFTIGFLSTSLLAFNQSIPINNDDYHLYGANSTWGAYLKVGGNGRGTTNASVVTTNGNLHLDSKDGNATFINHYSSGNTYMNTNGGIVGIGTSTPDSNAGLHMYQDRYTLYGPNSTWSAYLQVGGNGRQTTNASVLTTNGNLHLDSKNGSATYINHYSTGNTYLNTLGGNVGVGTTSPKEKLHLSNGDFFISSSTNTNNSTHKGIKFTTDNHSYFASISTYRGGLSKSIGLRFSTMNNSTIPITAMHIEPNGNIGIGSSSTGSHKLAVEGTIGAREIKVEASGWSDFVFEKDYTLRTLEEVEEHIAEKGHLPEIPSEAEVIENGINLGEMDAKLLQKIEELTLYLIEQNKEIIEMKKEISTLKKE